jgi:hypothetical protein
MRCLQINYDLSAPVRNYSAVYDYLRGFNGWCHALESMWFVRTAKSTTTVRDELSRLVDADDKIVVVDITGDAWATAGLPSGTLDWMHGHTAPALAA